MNSDRLPDYYEDLQISPNADLETIERVFRLLAKRYHPDNTDRGNQDAFIRISISYNVLPMQRYAPRMMPVMWH